MSLVLDSSVTLAWLYSDELTEAVERVFDRVARDRAWVPAIWRLEVANSLQVGIRRGRIDIAFRDASIADLAAMDIVTDPDTDTHAWAATLQLADRFGLTTHDAAYRELALRRNVPLASLDHDLRAAARSLGVTLLGDEE
jgi:predicted nucleic acid-binding protein